MEDGQGRAKYDLERFPAAPERDRAQARSAPASSEATGSGFPQLRVLGHSDNAEFYSIADMEEARLYLYNAKSARAELVADEMQAIREEILTWKAKMASQAANMAYNELLYEGLGTDGDRQ